MAGSVKRHHVVSEPVWWGNGSAGREIRCTTCSPARVLWQSSPYQPFDTTVAFLASVADNHQAEFGSADEDEDEDEDEEEPENDAEGDLPDQVSIH